MRRFMTTSFTVLALIAATAAVAGAGEAAPTAEISLFNLYMHAMPVAGILTLLSFVTFSLALTWTFSMRHEDLVPVHVAEEMHQLFAEGVTDEAVEQAKSVAAGQPTMLTNVIGAALERKDYGHQAMVEAAEEMGLSEHTKYSNKVGWLNLFASSAMLLGLLGTVSGIIGAFLKMGTQSNVDPSKLATSIGEALVCTFMGLFIAIVGLYFYFFLRTRVNQCALDTSVYAKEILDYFRSDR